MKEKRSNSPLAQRAEIPAIFCVRAEKNFCAKSCSRRQKAAGTSIMRRAESQVRSEVRAMLPISLKVVKEKKDTGLVKRL